MSTHRNTWKARERVVAAFFGSERTPLSGGNSKHTRSDSLSPIFFVEVKYRQQHSSFTLFRDTAAKAKLEGKTPVVVLCEKGKSEFLVIFSSKSLRKAMIQLFKIWAAQKFAIKRWDDYDE